MLWSIRARMKPALSVIEMIPDVHRTQALTVLRKAAQDGRVAGIRIDADDRDLVLYDGPVALISPIGARLLRALYQQGKIKLKKPAAKKLPALDAYIATEAAFRADVTRLLAEEDARLDRLAAIVADPECATADELTPYLVDKIITAKLGYGASGSVSFAGITAHRTRTADASSDAQTLDTGRILCWWVDQDGQRHGDVD
ncbi:hypothetical protein [Paracoccus sp. JM45]|uniref:hypothetical protein n=1 Tax=Paracoccus sp. JM45 TaxID=2283626 RepID=UPI000E6CDDC0|nr:hypothetical protein [Paracoccus sp. JM45]RJE81159.1 hypothetical protein DWB67_00370 [Paracoccus sp. JM45]